MVRSQDTALVSRHDRHTSGRVAARALFRHPRAIPGAKENSRRGLHGSGPRGMIPISEPPLKASERPMSQIDEQANTAPFFTTLVFCPSAAVAAEGKTRVDSPLRNGCRAGGPRSDRSRGSVVLVVLQVPVQLGRIGQVVLTIEDVLPGLPCGLRDDQTAEMDVGDRVRRVG